MDTVTTRRAGRYLLIGSGLLLAAVALSIHDLSNANRPHELRYLPVVAGLLAVNVIPCFRAQVLLWAVWPRRHQAPLRPRHYLLLLFDVSYACVSVFFLFICSASLLGRLIDLPS